MNFIPAHFSKASIILYFIMTKRGNFYSTNLYFENVALDCCFLNYLICVLSHGVMFLVQRKELTGFWGWKAAKEKTIHLNAAVPCNIFKGCSSRNPWVRRESESAFECTYGSEYINIYTHRRAAEPGVREQRIIHTRSSSERVKILSSTSSYLSCDKYRSS